jgi:hypothetical protein
MLDEISKQIQKPWAIVFSHHGLDFIGKVLREWNYGLKVAHSEDYEKSSEVVRAAGQIRIRRFDTSKEIRDYLIENYSENDLVQGVYNGFLYNFPSERANIEKLLAQSQPKFTTASIPSSEGVLGYDEDGYPYHGGSLSYDEEGYENNPLFPKGRPLEQTPFRRIDAIDPDYSEPND